MRKITSTLVLSMLSACGGGGGSSAVSVPVSYSISGTVSGLSAGNSVVLIDNGVNPVTIKSNVAVTFPDALAANSTYAVTVVTQPAGQFCSVANGSGIGVSANVSNVAVTCAAQTYSIGGHVTGLNAGAKVTVVNNGIAQDLTSNALYVLSTPIAYQSAYTVSVQTDPSGQTCSVTNGTGTSVSVNVINVNVSCATTIETVPHSFSQFATGYDVITLIKGSGGHFYGMTQFAGSNADGGGVFQIDQSGASLLELYSFPGTFFSGTPVGSLIQTSDGTLFGTTNAGGSHNRGTVLAITSGGVESPLYSFGTQGTDGSAPLGLVAGNDGFLYGVTSTGGTAGTGVLYKISTAGAVTNLIQFNQANLTGANPGAALMLASDNKLYGVTYYGSANGSNNNGAVFQYTPGGAEVVLHSFLGGASDGANPKAALIEASDGYLYGTTSAGGTSANGSIFKVAKDGSGYTRLYSFGVAPDGAVPAQALVEGTDGYLYGTTSVGGTNALGTIFKIAKDGTGYALLHSFTGNPGDGQQPSSALILGSDGHFYGSTIRGGSSNYGTFFRY